MCHAPQSIALEVKIIMSRAEGQKIASAIFMRTDKTIKAPIYNNNRALVPDV